MFTKIIINKLCAKSNGFGVEHIIKNKMYKLPSISTRRHYCDTTNKSNRNAIVSNSGSFDLSGTSEQQTSLVSIKRTLKNSPNECSDGYSCIKTVCPMCKPLPDSTSNNYSIYINKTTGKPIYFL